MPAYDINSQGIILQANTPFKHLFSGDVLGKNIEDLFEVKEIFNQPSVEIKAPNGQTDYLLNNYPSADDSVRGFLTDITSVKKSEHIKEKTNCLLESILDSLPVSISFQNAESLAYEFVNEHFANFFGKSKKDIIGKTVEDLFPFDVGEILTSKDVDLLKNGTSQVHDLTTIRGDGQKCELRIKKSLVFGGDRVLGIAGVNEDVTIINTLLYQVRDSIDKYKSLFENSIAGIYRTSLEDGELIVANQALANIFGYSSPQDMIGLNFSSLYVNPADRENLVSVLSEHGCVHNYKADFHTLSGDVITVRFSASLLGSIVEGFAQDVTELENSKREISKHEETIRLMIKNRDDMQRILSHDILNATGSIRSTILFLNDLLHESNNTSSDENDLIQLSVSSVNQLYYLVDNFMIMMRADKELVVEKKPTNLFDLVSSPVEMYKPTAYQNNCSIENLVPAEVSIDTDPMLLSVIVRNLLNNAVRNTHDGTVKIMYNRAPNMHEIVISDTGKGIDKESLSTIFKSKNSATHAGQSLGLQNSKNYALIMGGDIYAKSTLGKGTDFTVSLP